MPTEHYLARILNRITLPGSLFLAAVALTPSVLLHLWNITTIPFGHDAFGQRRCGTRDDETDRQPVDDA